ncbi:hypothetical protein E2C01_097911 [Portunus trituberculatus]|uniref:Uncharacterized protein n=1 Tax=Portunus trituberculatus TaxID=210409 RepID=A0A5B7K6V9_PORTR|nr:hypothetical protein [Portunus trituberculatus]
MSAVQCACDGLIVFQSARVVSPATRVMGDSRPPSISHPSTNEARRE